MAYELFELYPINPSQLAHYRKTFFSSGALVNRRGHSVSRSLPNRPDATGAIFRDREVEARVRVNDRFSVAVNERKIESVLPL
jgi:hypothetical protein